MEAYVLILWMWGYKAGGLAMYEFADRASCTAALAAVQAKSKPQSDLSYIDGLCVLKSTSPN